MKKLLLFLFFPLALLGQDSTKALNEVVVHGYDTERKLIETSAAINVLTIKEIGRFSNTNLLPVLNTMPGVRMEERSPGSYRLSIRGSSLRSPFGVRNVKTYWNDIPFTDANGISYLNLLDLQTIGTIEVLKGPASSVYGAGTGGVLLLGGTKATFEKNETQTPQNRGGLNMSFLFGNYNTQNRAFSWNTATEKNNSVLTYAHTQSDGWREHSTLARDILNWRSNHFVSSHKILNINVLYADIHYETPGGLTQAQMDKKPQAARPTIGAIKGAIEQNAGIYQKLFQLGFSQEYRWNEHWSNVISIFGTFNDYRNPFITNYEKRNEQTFGGRSRTTYQFDLGEIENRLSFGAEFARTYSVIRNYGNKAGVLDTLQTDDEISAWQHFYFAQIETKLPQNIIFTLGGSYNFLTYNFLRISDAPNLKPVTSTFSPVFSPRVAVLKNFRDKISIFGSVSNGFSPPTITEFITGYRNPNYFANLSPENGTNYEIGTRGNLLKNRMTFEVVYYSLHLQNTIVRRQDNAGQDFYSNAGNTLQNGLEFLYNYLIINDIRNNRLKFFTSFTLNNYHFINYKQGIVDYSGNELTGVPKQVWIVGLDAKTKCGFYLNSTMNFTDKLPLNDANSVYAKSYWLLSGRLGYKHNFRYISANIFAGVDNAMNQLYSLGNDTNATGNRYFNPAPPRNFYVGGSFLFKI